MKTRLITMLERTIVNLRDIIAALERDDVDEAEAKLAMISDRFSETIDELRVKGAA